MVEALEKRLFLTVTGATVAPPTSNVVAGASLDFGLQATSDDSLIAGWRFAFGDGQFATIDGNPSSISHVFSQVGNLTIAGMAYDGDDIGAPEAPPLSSGYNVTQTLAVSPPSFNIIASSGVSVQAGQPFSATVGVINGFFGDAGDFSAAISLSGVSATCVPDGYGKLPLNAAPRTEVKSFFVQSERFLL